MLLNHSSTNAFLILLLSFDKSLNLGAVAFIKDKCWESLAHFTLSEVEGGVEFIPELFLSWGSSLIVPLDFVHAEGSENSQSSLVSFFSLEVRETALTNQNKEGESWGTGETNKLTESLGISGRDSL